MDGKHNVLTLVCVALLATGVSASHPDSSDWEDVFNADLSNAECSKPGWSWKSDGYLVPETSETLFSRKDYTNFVLDVAYVAEPTANSGVFLYDTSHPKCKFEVQILDDLDPKYRGKPVSILNTGSIYGRCSPKKIASRPSGELNRMTIWCKGPLVRIVLNGEEVLDVNLFDWKNPLVNPDGTSVPKWHRDFPALGSIPMHGRIALQGLHGGKAVRFKYIRAKSL